MRQQSPQVHSQWSEVAFTGNVCFQLPRELLPAAVGAGEGREQQGTGMGSCWGKGIRGNPGSGRLQVSREECWGCSPSRRVGEAWKYNGENALFGVWMHPGLWTGGHMSCWTLLSLFISRLPEIHVVLHGGTVRLVLAQGENKCWLDWAVQILSSCFKSVLSDFPSCSVSVGQLTHLSGLWLVVQHLPALWQGECALTTQEQFLLVHLHS